jgi:hypothetical protein
MKKLILFAVATLCFTNVYSQTKFAEYGSGYFNKTREISLSDDEKKGFILWIDAFGLDQTYDDGGIHVEESRYDSFFDALKEAREKYIEWTQTAKDNNVKKLNKEMPYKCRVSSYFGTGRVSSTHFQFLVNLAFDYMVLEAGGEIKYMLILRTGRLTASDNKYIDSEGFVIPFESIQEIDEFISTIEIGKIKEVINAPKPDELFK